MTANDRKNTESNFLEKKIAKIHKNSFSRMIQHRLFRRDPTILNQTRNNSNINMKITTTVISDSGLPVTTVNGAPTSVKDLGAIRIIAIMVAPILVFILLSWAIWTMYKKGLFGNWSSQKKRKFKKDPNNQILMRSSSRTTSIHPSLLKSSSKPYPTVLHSHSFSSSNASSIPEYSEWLESASQNQKQPETHSHYISHQKDVEKSQRNQNTQVLPAQDPLSLHPVDPFASSIPLQTSSSSIEMNSTPHPIESHQVEIPSEHPSPLSHLETVNTTVAHHLRIETQSLHPPPPALSSASHTIASSNNGPITPINMNEYTQGSYQNTHILGTLQHNNTWKLGGLKYTTRDQLNTSPTMSSPHPELNLSNWWNGKKTSSSSLSHQQQQQNKNNKSSWWRQKSQINLKEKEKSMIDYDSFHVW